MTITREQMVAVLGSPMDPPTNGAKAHSVWEYVLKLAGQVWAQGESFSGKRPFGDSSWEDDIVQALASRGLLSGPPGDDGDFTWDQQMEAGTLVAEALALAAIAPYEVGDDEDDSVPAVPDGVNPQRWNVYHQAQRCLGMAGEPRDVLHLASFLYDGPGF